MKYLYKAIWYLLYRIHLKTLGAIYPIVKWAYSLRYPPGNTKAEEWKRNFNYVVVQFPDGILEGTATSLVMVIVLVPVMLFTLKFVDYIYTEIWYVYALFGFVALLVYYILFHRNIDWLTEHINELKKNNK